MIINDMPGGGLNSAGSATQPVYINANGEAAATTYALNKTVPSNAVFTDTDTKNTAGSTDTSSKIFLIGATSQAANPQTYSHDTAYVGTDGCVYSGGVKTLTSHQTLKTINSTSLVGSGNISIPALPDVGSSDNGKILMVVSGAWAKAEFPRTKYPVGGRIFYDNGGNGLTYTFYDGSGNVLSTQTVSGLASAATYTVDGAATPRWYVYDTAGLTSGLYWGYYNTSVGITGDGIGVGATNTATVLAKGVPTDYTPNIWSFIQGKRTGKYNNCDDWFIASKTEQDRLRSSGLVNWYSSNYIWSSVERNSNYAYGWYYDDSGWGSGSKDDDACAFAARAF